MKNNIKIFLTKLIFANNIKYFLFYLVSFVVDLVEKVFICKQPSYMHYCANLIYLVQIYR